MVIAAAEDPTDPWPQMICERMLTAGVRLSAHRGRVQGAMPDAGDIARKRPMPRASRRGRRSAPCRCAWWLMRWPVLRQFGSYSTAIGRIGHHQKQRYPGQRTARHRWRWCCRRRATGGGARIHRSPGRETGSAGSSDVILAIDGAAVSGASISASNSPSSSSEADQIDVEPVRADPVRSARAGSRCPSQRSTRSCCPRQPAPGAALRSGAPARSAAPRKAPVAVPRHQPPVAGDDHAVLADQDPGW